MLEPTLHENYPILMGKMRQYTDVEKKMLELCAVTGLSLEEVQEQTKGAGTSDLDTIITAAALTGSIMDFHAAHDVVISNFVL